MAGYGRALLVPIVAVFTLGAFYAGVAPALTGLFDTVGSFGPAQSSVLNASGILSDIRFIVFILGPMLFLLGALLFPIVFGVRREVFLGGRR
jgi:hypothetical protein